MMTECLRKQAEAREALRRAERFEDRPRKRQPKRRAKRPSTTEV